MRRRLVLLLSGSLLLPVARAGDTMPAAERERVERLIQYVEKRTDCAFLRNGKTYDSKDAAAFLREKLNHMGDGVTTAHQFIEQIASRSSMSGEPYLIRHADGRTESSARFLGDELKRIDASKTR